MYPTHMLSVVWLHRNSTRKENARSYKKGPGLKYKMQFNKTLSWGTNIARIKNKDQKLLIRAIKSQKKQLSNKQDFPQYSQSQLQNYYPQWECYFDDMEHQRWEIHQLQLQLKIGPTSKAVDFSTHQKKLTELVFACLEPRQKHKARWPNINR